MDNQPNPHPVTEEESSSPEDQSVQPESTEPVKSEATSTAQTPPVLSQPKSSHHRLWTIVGIIIVLIIIVVLAGIALGHSDQTAKTQTKSTSAESADDLTSAMTQGANGESAITSTDDSGAAANMNQSAGNVGDSVNENNF